MVTKFYFEYKKSYPKPNQTQTESKPKSDPIFQNMNIHTHTEKIYTFVICALGVE